MSHDIQEISVETLKAYLHDGDEIALLDAREEVPFDQRHLLMAACVPLGRIEIIVDALVPRRTVRVVWCDDGDGLAAKAAARMSALGYSNVAILQGSIGAWEAAGYPIYQGIHVPSKAFAEVVEHDAGTPYISAQELKHMMDANDDFVLLDSRSYEEYHGNSIPGAVSVPGAELVYRFKDLVPSPDTKVVVNCGGRTRSIIGAQALIDAGFENQIVSLMNGTQAWHLEGYDVIVGATKTAPHVSDEGRAVAKVAAARVAERHQIKHIDDTTLDKFKSESLTRSLYILDVRTQEEYEAGHMPGAKHIPGGQLVQETDRHTGTWGSRVVLVDDIGVRATMTASWLKQMGWDVAVFTLETYGGDLESGPHKPRTLGLKEVQVPTIDAAALDQELITNNVCVVDVNWSKGYDNGHIPGAWFLLRSRIASDLQHLPTAEQIVVTCPDGELALLAAADIAASTNTPVKALDGGTGAWAATGLALEKGRQNMASVADDIRLKAREEGKDIEAAMHAYLAWEIELVNQMATDDDQRFNILSKAG